MDFKKAFGLAFKEARIAKKLTQEDFGVVSSRTYISTIERGLKSVTLDKLNEISTVLNIHPMTLIGMAFLKLNKNISVTDLSQQISSEMTEIAKLNGGIN